MSTLILRRTARQHFGRTAGIILLMVLVSSDSLGADFDYPELMVVPRASERLQMEAQKERDGTWTMHLPVQISATSTLVSALALRGDGLERTDPNNYASLAGMIVGGGWLATTLGLSAFYEPYQSAWSEIKGMPAKSVREQLARERMAEEAIDRASAMAWRLALLSTATNFGTSLFLNSESEKNSFASTATLVSMAASAAPLIFTYRWIRVAREQREYKKRIYAPVASMILARNVETGSTAPGLALTFEF